MGLLPYSAAQALWLILTAVPFFLSARRFAPLPYALANPINLIVSFAGQTGFLIGAIFLSGILLLDSAPFAAGVVLGLLILKPQLALMLPVAMIAGRRWQTIGAAAASAIFLLLAGLALFGPDSYRGFFAMAQRLGSILRESGWPWTELVSPFAFARYLGVGQEPALILQAVIAICAAASVWIAWARDWQERVPILAAATMLASPYLFTYDATLMVVPAGYLVARRRYWALALLWLLCALPVLFPLKLYRGPNTIPVAAVMALGLLIFDHRRNSERSATPSGGALQHSPG